MLWNHRFTKGACILAFISGIVETKGDLLWSSTGGGWRAMFADMGYANVFRQAGLFDETSTKFEAISTTSGASWFSTQLFYSKVFYDRSVLADTPDDLEAFVLDWMDSYLVVSGDIDQASEDKCSILKDLGKEGFLPEACALSVEHDGSWANFVHAMLKATGAGMGDPDFYERVVNSENRIEPLAKTDLLVQTALMPNSRYIEEGEEGPGTDVYLGYPDDDESSDPNLFTVPLSATFVVEDTKAGYWFGADDLAPELHTYTAPSPAEYDPSDWEEFYLKQPAKDGTLTIKGSAIGLDTSSSSGILAPPFGGPETSTTVKLAATSSAAGGYPSPAAPSIWAQFIATTLTASMAGRASGWKKLLFGTLAGLAVAYLMRWLIQCRDRGRADYESIPGSNCCSKADICVPIACCLVVGGLVFTFYSFGSVLIPVAFDKVSDVLFHTGDLDGLSICSQWPHPCGANDGQFSDGLLADGPAVAANVGHHLKTKGVNPDEPLKLILTNTNELSKFNGTANMGQLCQYFETDFNKGVEPGGFLWNPGIEVPYRSPQIFKDYVTKEFINANALAIPNSNMTTVTFSTTTVENLSYGVSAGQPVEILLLNLNAIMTTMVVGESAVLEYRQPLADMTNHVAFNKDLLQRVSSFVHDD